MEKRRARWWWVVGLAAAFWVAGLWRPGGAVANGTNLASFQRYEAAVNNLLQAANPPVPLFQLTLLETQMKATEGDIRAGASFDTVFEDFQVFIRLWADYQLPGNYVVIDPQTGQLTDLSAVVQKDVQGIVESLAHDPALNEDLDDTVEIFSIQQWFIDDLPSTENETPGF